MSMADGMDGSERGTVDHNLIENANSKEINTEDDLMFGQVSNGFTQAFTFPSDVISMAYPIISSEDGLMFDQANNRITQAFTFPTEVTNVSSPITSSNAFERSIPAQGRMGYNLRSQRVPNPDVDFSELIRQRAVSEQHSLAATWTKSSNWIERDLNCLRTIIYSSWDPYAATEAVVSLERLWNSFEKTHSQYVKGIKEKKRLEVVETKYRSLKEMTTHVMDEFHQQVQVDERPSPRQDDELSLRSHKSHSSLRSTSSKLSSASSQKEKLRTMLVAKTKLKFALERKEEEAMIAKANYEQNAKKEIRMLQEEAELAELDWKIEAEYNDETRSVKDLISSVAQSTPCTEPLVQMKDNSSGSTIPYSNMNTTTHNYREKTVHDATPTRTGNRPNTAHCAEQYTSKSKQQLHNPAVKQDTTKPSLIDINTCNDATLAQLRIKDSQSPVPAEKTSKDPVAAMLNIQLLNGMRPTQFNGNPSDFPFFRKQVREHLEIDLLSDVQRIEYLPKFLSGDALDVIKRNRGCSYDDLIKTLEARYGRPIQVSQACIEELASGPKLAYGDNIGLLNFAEKLNSATKILTGPDEQEVSVATNLRRIVNRLPNDLIARWQTENYEIVKRGSSARLSDIAKFVLKHASIRNDPVFGSLKKETTDTRINTKPQSSTYKQSTIATTTVDNQPANLYIGDFCDICRGPIHNLKHCPTIKQCEHVAIRRQYAASYRFCFNCGKPRPGHGSGTCPDMPSCSRCGDRHLDILHKDLESTPKNANGGSYGKPKPSRNVKEASPSDRFSRKEETTKTKPQAKEVSSAAVSATKSLVLLNVLPVIITSSDKKSVSTYAFLDNGCTDSFIDQQLADHLGIKGTPEEIQISTLTTSHETTKTQRVSFTLRSTDGSGHPVTVNNAYVLPDLNQSDRVLPETVDISDYPHLRDIQFYTVDIQRVSILIGSNIPSAHLQTEVRVPHDSNSGPFAYRYPLGWSLCGPTNTVNSQTASVNHATVQRELDERLERFWRLEDNGISNSSKDSLSVEDRRALKIIHQTTRMVDGHYEVGLPWREERPKLPDNRSLAERRLELLKRRLMKPENEELAAKYREVMNSYVEKGYARKLTEEEIEAESQIRWYLPHHPVTNDNKPGKVRIVFDAAAEFQGVSLNKSLLQGPDSTNNLVGVLLRFRQDNIALAADVESMFHQVRVPLRDQQALRFLWWTNGYKEPPDVYVMQVHIFGATSSPCVVNSTLRRTADDNADQFNAETVNAVKRNFYVDDGLPSTKDETSAKTLASELVKILDQGGFNLTKFTSNSKVVLADVPPQRRIKPELDLDFDELPVERALGVRWHVETDELGFQIKELKRPETKRGVLSTVCSLYDPLGFAAPVTLSAKNLIQDLWKAKCEWDQPLEDRFLQRWKKWKAELNSLSTIRVPRSYFPPGTFVSQCQLQLHHFSDASEIGYGTSSYLRVKFPDDTIHCAFIMGKSRNAPVKFTSIPRLELQAAVLATRMNSMLREELDLDIKKTTYWTDSEIVLHYLKNEKRRFQTYVANRIEQIKENSHVEEWNHVPGVLNPADDASRGLNPSELFVEHRWLHGPQFLWQPESYWPSSDPVGVADDMLELKKSHAYHTDVKPEPVKSDSSADHEAVLESQPISKLQQMISDCSDWTRIRRKIAWLIRFTRYIRDRKNVQTGRLTLDECDAATLAIVRIVQNCVYEGEIADLKKSKPVKSSSKIANLNPTLDVDGVLRVNGRVRNAANIQIDSQQMILPRDHHISTLIVRHTHERNGHLGREHVMAKLRERYWIPRARVLIRSNLRHCLVCRKLNAKPITQQMAPLPKDRTTAYNPPFTNTGMDLFGPMYVKHGRGTAKRWCCLFTCLNTRCVHLEVVHSMSTDDFIMCLRRFLNRRGDVAVLRCDNGSNFVGGERELRENIERWNQNQIEQELIQRSCKWIFQPPTASSMSGVWERLVRSAKTVLKSIIGSHTVTDAVLSTVLTEVERILNSRALTAVSDDPNDLEALTPAHFLMQRQLTGLPPGAFDKTDGIPKRQWRQTQYLADLFWTRWMKEYLPTLQIRQKWRSVKENVKENDLVLLVDNSTPRGRWNLGRVLETYRGVDGLVRTVKVKTRDSVLTRPIQKLCLLEDDLNPKCDSN